MVNMNGRNTNGRNINADGNNRGCGCRKDNTRAMLLRHVQMHGFAMIEAGLYLDGHPDCRRALEYFRRQRELYMKYAAEYEAAYGPLTIASQTTAMRGNGCRDRGPGKVRLTDVDL